MAIFQHSDDKDSRSRDALSTLNGSRSMSSNISSVSTTQGETVIGSSVSLEGDFASDENIVIHGNIKGTVTTKQDLTVGESAHVEADVQAENITVSGTVKGVVQAKGRLKLTSTGKITGDITTETLAVEEGAQITGQFSMGADAAKTKHVSEFLQKEELGSSKSKEEETADTSRGKEAESTVEKLLTNA